MWSVAHMYAMPAHPTRMVAEQYSLMASSPAKIVRYWDDAERTLLARGAALVCADDYHTGQRYWKYVGSAEVAGQKCIHEAHGQKEISEILELHGRGTFSARLAAAGYQEQPLVEWQLHKGVLDLEPYWEGIPDTLQDACVALLLSRVCMDEGDTMEFAAVEVSYDAEPSRDHLRDAKKLLEILPQSLGLNNPIPVVWQNAPELGEFLEMQAEGLR